LARKKYEPLNLDGLCYAYQYGCDDGQIYLHRKKLDQYVKREYRTGELVICADVKTKQLGRQLTPTKDLVAYSAHGMPPYDECFGCGMRFYYKTVLKNGCALDTVPDNLMYVRDVWGLAEHRYITQSGDLHASPCVQQLMHANGIRKRPKLSKGLPRTKGKTKAVATPDWMNHLDPGEFLAMLNEGDDDESLAATFAGFQIGQFVNSDDDDEMLWSELAGFTTALDESRAA
jgi:hypothetical protein